MISVLTSFKVSSLACECVLYMPEHNSKTEPHGIEFRNSSNAKIKCTNG